MERGHDVDVCTISHGEYQGGGIVDVPDVNENANTHEENA